MNLNKINKRGASFKGWTEAIIMVCVLLVLFGKIISESNRQYNRNDDGSLGLNTNTFLDKFNNITGTSQNTIQTGDVQTTNTVWGLSFTGVWSIMVGVFTTLGGFFVPGSGGSIYQIVVGLLHLPVVLATGFQILFFISIIFIVIKIFMKVKP